MKKLIKILIPALGAVLLVQSCNKEVPLFPQSENDGLIRFTASEVAFSTEATKGGDADLTMSVVKHQAGKKLLVISDPHPWRETNATKTSEVSSVPSTIYVSAYDGGGDAIWGSTAFSGTPYTGGRFWGEDNSTYNFYASNVALTGKTVTVSSDTDVIAAKRESATYKSSNLLTFTHVLSRIGSVNVVAAAGYTITDVTINITPMVSGTYDIAAGTWSNTVAGSEVNLAKADGTVGSKTSNLYVVPGTYSVNISWHAEKGALIEDYEDVAIDMDLRSGIVNNYAITLGGVGDSFHIRRASNRPR